MIEVKNLTKRYGNHLAVDHLNFTVESGKIYGFLGPNGAGKSTTMNIMTGYLGATEGQVLIDGHDILKEPEEAKKNIGYLPEIPPLYMEMTVLEYLEFAAELKGIKKDKREPQIEEVIRLAKLRDVENRLIQNLSNGYKQRVGLAQAVLGFPEIIILDEPTVGLDPKQIIEIRELIRKLAKKHTVILSSHILAEVREVCDYIMIISGGKLVASDTTENLENMMSGKGQIEVEAKASRDEMDHIIRRTGKIKEVKYRTSASGITTAQIIAKGGEDIREELFLAFSHADVPMLTWFTKNLSSFDFCSLDTTKKCTDVVTSLSFIKKFTEHFNTCYNSLLSLFVNTNDFYFVRYMKNTTLYSTCSNCTTSCDREYVLYWHKEWLICITFWIWNIRIYSIHEFHDLISPL